MADQTLYQVQRGEVVSDCMQSTFDFIEENLDFFYHNLKEVRDLLEADDFFLFISHEDRWSFSCRVDKAELGKVANGAGVVREGSTCPYDEIKDILTYTEE